MRNLHIRKAWLAKQNLLHLLTDYAAWLRTLAELFDIPKYSDRVSTPTGSRVRVQKDSAIPAYLITANELTSYSISDELKRVFRELRTGRGVTLYTVVSYDNMSRPNTVLVASLVDTDRTESGSGTIRESVVTALCFTPAYRRVTIDAPRSVQKSCDHNWTTVQSGMSGQPRGQRCTRCGLQEWF